MPVIFATGAPTASGHVYEDIYAVRYEFPAAYRNLVEEGDRFLYYRGRRAPGSGGAAVYLGDGIVGAISPSRNAGKLIAEVHDVATYADPVSLKAADGTYRETGTTAMTNFANGVRRVTDVVFDAILAAVSPGADREARHPGAYASPQHSRLLERYSIGVAIDLLAQEFGPHMVREMPPGNPGFDIEVLVDPPVHVEVKGTVLPDPVFHISEGQRQHAELLRGRFRLVVVYDVNLGRRVHRVVELRGPLTPNKVALRPEAYAGVVL